jgi:hypothetical protein
MRDVSNGFAGIITGAGPHWDNFAICSANPEIALPILGMNAAMLAI